MGFPDSFSSAHPVILSILSGEILLTHRKYKALRSHLEFGQMFSILTTLPIYTNILMGEYICLLT